MLFPLLFLTTILVSSSPLAAAAAMIPSYNIDAEMGGSSGDNTPFDGHLLKAPQQSLKLSSQISLNPNNKPINAFKRKPSIEIYGNKFFYSNNGSQFFIRGIAYQPDYNMYRLPDGWNHLYKPYIDPLSIPEICQRDIGNLKKLNVNTLRIYAIDPSLDHDYCMNLLAENDIYVLADLSEPKTSIVREIPSWDVDLYERYTDVVTAMQKYDNMLGFFAGNEVITDVSNVDAGPFIKASVRDTKRFIKEKGYRKIPIGYSTNDDATTRKLLKDYFICGGVEDVKIDFYGVNNYEWCGHSTFRTSGYSERLEEFKNYPIPVFFSEFGCNTVRPRPFTEVDSLFSPLMTEVFSGGIMYMYFEEQNNYGIVQADDFTNITSPVTILEEFKFLQYQFGKINPQGVDKKSYVPPSVKNVKQCPVQKTGKQISNILPKTPDLFRCGCVMSALACAKSPLARLTVEDVKDIYTTVCEAETITCAKLRGNGSKGEYGIFSSCRKNQRLSILMNEFYYKHQMNASYCDFNGRASAISTRNTVKDLSMITDSSNSNSNSKKNQTCFSAIGGEQHINPLYGIFTYEKENTNEVITNTTIYEDEDKKLKSAANGNQLDLILMTCCLVFSMFLF